MSGILPVTERGKNERMIDVLQQFQVDTPFHIPDSNPMRLKNFQKLFSRIFPEVHSDDSDNHIAFSVQQSVYSFRPTASVSMLTADLTTFNFMFLCQSFLAFQLTAISIQLPLTSVPFQRCALTADRSIKKYIHYPIIFQSQQLGSITLINPNL